MKRDVMKIVRYFGYLLNRKQKLTLIGIGIMMIMGAFIETFSVSLILPITTVILDDGFFNTNIYVHRFCALFNITSATQFLIVMLIILMAAIVFKNIYVYVEFYIQEKYGSSCILMGKS